MSPVQPVVHGVQDVGHGARGLQGLHPLLDAFTSGTRHELHGVLRMLCFPFVRQVAGFMQVVQTFTAGHFGLEGASDINLDRLPGGIRTVALRPGRLHTGSQACKGGGSGQAL